MKTVPYDFVTWPRTEGGDPIFTCTEEAFSYAQYIVYDDIERRRLIATLRSVVNQFQVLKAQDNPDLVEMAQLADKSQYLRECLEELSRLNKGGL